MRDASRIDRILGKLRAYWHAHPDLRLGQIVVNLSEIIAASKDPFYVEDDQLERVLPDVCTTAAPRHPDDAPTIVGRKPSCGHVVALDPDDTPEHRAEFERRGYTVEIHPWSTARTMMDSGHADCLASEGRRGQEV